MRNEKLMSDQFFTEDERFLTGTRKIFLMLNSIFEIRGKVLWY